MGGVARIAAEQGHQVAGADANVYPPMSIQLEQLGIELHEGYLPDNIKKWNPDLVIIGNALSRGNPAVEFVLDRELAFASGPQWMFERVLRHRWVLAVAGTHGKTTTTSALCWLLEYAGHEPGFLVGGIPENFGVSARLGRDPYFVIEADEYDTAFFDKRSKFVHYQPRTLILNNLEYDHADIFDTIEEIKKQFHHLLRTVPGSGMVIINADDKTIAEVVAQGCWSKQEHFSVIATAQWSAQPTTTDFSEFDVQHKGEEPQHITSPLIGVFNMSNILAAIAAASHAGVTLAKAAEAMPHFKSVKRRLQLLATVNNVRIYDDFAHHPTAISQTLKALRQLVENKRIICVLEPRSNTMLSGKHKQTLRRAFNDADQVYVYQPEGAKWNMAVLADQTVTVCQSVGEIIRLLVSSLKPDDYVVIMSNGGFDNIHQKLIDALDVTELTN